MHGNCLHVWIEISICLLKDFFQPFNSKCSNVSFHAVHWLFVESAVQVQIINSKECKKTSHSIWEGRNQDCLYHLLLYQSGGVCITFIHLLWGNSHWSPRSNNGILRVPTPWISPWTGRSMWWNSDRSSLGILCTIWYWYSSNCSHSSGHFRIHCEMYLQTSLL